MFCLHVPVWFHSSFLTVGKSKPTLLLKVRSTVAFNIIIIQEILLFGWKTELLATPYYTLAARMKPKNIP